jgi:hypothetical protein
LLDVTAKPDEFKLAGPAFNTAGHLAPNVAIQEQPCYQNLVINKYYARSRQDWLEKLQRGSATTDDASPQQEAGLLDRLAEACRVKDETIKAFAPAVRQLLGLDPAASQAPEATSSGPAAQAPAVPAAAAPTMTASILEPATAAQGARSEPPPQPAAAVIAPAEAAPGWLARGQDAQERAGGLGLVFRDRSRPGEHWLAALRGAAATAIDPAFLRDEFDRICDFPTDAQAREACDAALAQRPG